MRFQSNRSSSAVVCCRPVWTPKRVISSERSRVRETAAMPRASVATTNPARVEIEYETFGSPDDPVAAARDGVHGPADRVGRRRSARRWPAAAATSSASTTATAACRPTSTASRSNPAEVMRAAARRHAEAADAVHAVGHGQRRRRPARRPRHRPGPRRRRVDGRDDRPDDRHRAPRAVPEHDVDHELARRSRVRASRRRRRSCS